MKNNFRNRPKDWKIEDYFTALEIAEAQLSIKQDEAKQEKIKIAIAKDQARLSSINRPSIPLTNYAEQIIYYLEFGDGKLADRLTKGMLCHMWDKALWDDLLVKIVRIKCIEDGLNLEKLISEIEAYFDLPRGVQDALFIESLSLEERQEFQVDTLSEYKVYKRRD